MKINLSRSIKVLAVLLMAASIASCTVLKTHTTKTMDIYGAGVIQKPVLVDLEVKDAKVTGTATSISGEPIATTKNNAVYDALKNANADVLVEPKFESESSNGKTTVTATGFPAIYKNFRPITEKDTALLKVGIIQKANVYEPTNIVKKSGGAGVIGGIVGGVALVILLLLGL